MKSSGKLREVAVFSVSSRRNIFLTAALSVLTYIALIWSSNPDLSSRTLANGYHLVNELFWILTAGSVESAGTFGFALILLYSILTGMTLTTLIAQVQLHGFGNLFRLGGVAPGIVASGCAGCGAGLAAVLGLSSALTLLPYNGNLLRLGGIALLLFFLSSSGDPRKCEISDG